MLLNHDHYITQVDTEEIIVSLRKDGIIHVYIKPNIHIDIDVQKRMLAAYWKVTDVRRPFVFEVGEFTSISKEARQNATKIEEDAPVAATAIVVTNLGHRIIADYYYKFNRPKRPIKIFKNSESAVEWLSQYLSE